jgi:hypothetical protein
MAYDIDELIHAEALIDGKWVISRPIKGPFISRLKDAIGVLKGKYDAVKFEKQ